MTQALIPAGTTLPARLQSRATARALASIDHGRQLAIAQAEATADIQAAKVDAVAYVGRVAMHDVAMLSQLEQQLAQLVPVATSRLQAIGDMTTLGLTEIVMDTVRQLSR